MPPKEYRRKPKETRPVVAICYDFDKTLSPTDMQAQGYIQDAGYDPSKFWAMSNDLAENNDMDQNLAYMYMMVKETSGNVRPTRKTLAEYGAKVALFPGVEGWFERIRAYGERQDVIIEHYIISSGLKEMIDGTSIGKAGVFEKVFASSFLFDADGVAIWPAQAVNYTNKTQFLFRIEKGVLDINDDGVNDCFAPGAIRVPFRNMIYIGDSDTDIPCMKLVNTYGGHAIGVYDAATVDKSKVFQMTRDKRIKYFAPADYTANSELDRLVKAIIDRTATNERLESASLRCQAEAARDDQERDEEERRRNAVIRALADSGDLAGARRLFARLAGWGDSWNAAEKDRLFALALRNGQVRRLLAEPAVAAFYRGLLQDAPAMSESARKVKAILDAGAGNA